MTQADVTSSGKPILSLQNSPPIVIKALFVCTLSISMPKSNWKWILIMDDILAKLCPSLYAYTSCAWPDATDQEYPPLCRIFLSPNVTMEIKSVFELLLENAVSIDENLFVNDAQLWAALWQAERLCENIGHSVTYISVD